MNRISITSLLAAVILGLSVGCQEPDLRGQIPSQDDAKAMRIELSKSQSGDGGGTQKVAPIRTGWATLRGKITVNGAVSANPPLNVDKNQDICKPGGRPVVGEEVMVDTATGGLANVLIYALNLKGDNIHEDATGGKTDEVVYDQKVCRYLTHVFAVQSTQVMKIKNSDSIPHNTLISPVRAASLNANIPPYSSVPYTPGKEERKPISVKCSIHPWMQAYLLPRNNGYFATTEKDGSFEIANLPAGIDLSIQLWHEKLKTNFKGVPVNGVDPKWKKGRMKLKLDNDEVRKLEIVIPAKAFE